MNNSDTGKRDRAFTTDMLMGDNFPSIALDILKPVIGHKLRCLEIGVYEGCCACWLLDNILTHPESTYTGVDNWECENKEAEETAYENLIEFGSKVELIKGKSFSALRWLASIEAEFDIIRIDGDHNYLTVTSDLKQSWNMLVVGGLLFCDDVMRDDYGVSQAIHTHLFDLPPTSYKILYWDYHAVIKRLK